MANEAAGMCCVTMDRGRYPATLDIGVPAEAYESCYVLVATVSAFDMQILDGVVRGSTEHGATHLDGMSVAIEHTLEVIYGSIC